jgi:photosystem II stability/assembly factor-like uncharacterized protein
LSFPLRYSSVIVVLLLFFGAGSSRASWNKIAQFNNEYGTCGFFWDEQHGLAGFGQISQRTNIVRRIRWTTDGGSTWTLSITPGGKGAVTTIIMKDQLVGYASVYSPTNTIPVGSIWKTTDGGKSWQDNSFGNDAITPCVYSTSHALIRTTWYSGTPGGVSLDDGRTFSHLFTTPNGDNNSNGIDFTDDISGVTTVRSVAGSTSPFFSRDGGLTWNSGLPIPEAWSVYALKGTQSFIVMPEGSATSFNSTCYRSDDGGFSWNPIFSFPQSTHFTGHLGGKGNTLYAQTDVGSSLGLFRSDNLGTSWKNVGGPSTVRDTRFVVTGCNSEIVYAFDDNGSVWKTTDGGDGTLVYIPDGNGKKITLKSDSVFVSAFCNPVRAYVTFKNPNCITFSIDSITISPDLYHEFTIDTLKNGFSLYPDLSASIPIKFQTDSNISRTTNIHVFGKTNGKVFDTTVIFTAEHLFVPGPLIGFADPLMISGTCAPARGYVQITNRNCDSLKIDSMSILPDLYGEFMLDTIKQLLISSNGIVNIPAVFTTDSSVTRQTFIHIHGHSGIRTIDTIISLVASHSTITGPLLAFASDSVAISSTCVPADGNISITNRNCDSLTIDSIRVAPDKYREFSIDTSILRSKLLSNNTLDLPVHFTCDSDLVRNTTIHIYGHSGNRIIDTTVIFRAQHSTNPGPLMAMPFDSLYFETRYCQPLRQYINFANVNCNPLIIDSVWLDPQYPELIIDTSQNPKLGLGKFSSGGVPIFFQTDSNITRRTTMRIIGHSFERIIDTTLILVAKHSTAPEPMLGIPSTAKVGDTVLIPVFLRPTLDSFTISHYALHLSFDGDVISPSYSSYETINTLSFGASIAIDKSEANGVLCTVDFPTALTEKNDLTLPLIYLRMKVTLSRYLFSNVRLDTFSISTTAPLPLCTIPQTLFVVDPQCGEPTLSHFMFDGSMPELSIYPNPNSGNTIEALIYLPTKNSISVEVIDALGKGNIQILQNQQFEKGEHLIHINAASLVNGKYILRMITHDGETVAREIVILK